MGKKKKEKKKKKAKRKKLELEKKLAKAKKARKATKGKKSKGKRKEEKPKKAKKNKDTAVHQKRKEPAPKNMSLASKKATPIVENLGLKEKISELFAYRQIPWMLDISSISDREGFEQKLITLQENIYALDHYLESNWKLSDRGLKQQWSGIRKAVGAFGIPRNKVDAMLRQILKYQSHEESLRTPKSPTRFSMRHLYYYKSCDVRLMRTLIYGADPGLTRILKPSDWNEFDLITEVNDDVADLNEDRKLLNGNRLLFDVYELGKAKAEQNFRSFIREIELKNADRFRTRKSAEARHVKGCTTRAIRETRSLLKTSLSSLDLSEIASADVIQARTEM